MTNTQYTEKVFTSVERIIVDTSTLMQAGFQKFIINNRDRLLASGKQLIVTKSVYSELARLLGMDRCEKCNRALQAIEVISQNRELFKVENVPLTEDEIARAFADAQILSELTLHKSDYNQLLITNDRKLSCDAFDLNQLQSCKGRRVLVCYINDIGEMQCCECARPTLGEERKEMEETPSPAPTQQEQADLFEEHIEDKNNWKFDWKSGATGVFVTGVIYGLWRNRKSILNLIKL